MRTSLLVSSILVLSLACFGCSGPGTSSGTDGGEHRDTGASDIDSGSSDVDSGSSDVDSGSSDVDSGSSDVDSGSSDVDSGSSSTDTGVVGDAGPCVEPGLGDPCGDTAGGADCPTGFECDLGRCLPQGRETCGGFAGAPCHDPVRSECVYETGHGDVATCFSPAEVRCLCARDSARWSC